MHDQGSAVMKTPTVHVRAYSQIPERLGFRRGTSTLAEMDSDGAHVKGHVDAEYQTHGRDV